MENEYDEKIKKLPLPLRALAQLLKDNLDKIVHGGCDETEVTRLMADYEIMKEGKYGDGDLLTYDKAAKELGMSVTNRAKLKQVLDDNGIHQVKITNMRVGFDKWKVKALFLKLMRKKKEKENSQR